jgi:hypothetical protein
VSLWKTFLQSENASPLCASSWTDSFGRERREHRVFEQLLDSYPGLLERLRNGSEEEILHVGVLVRCFLRCRSCSSIPNLKLKVNLEACLETCSEIELDKRGITGEQ